MSELSYMDKLLDGVEVEWKALGEVTTINTGQKPSDVLDVPTVYDYINAGTSRSGYSTSSNCEGDTVTTPSRGQGGIGYVGYQRQPFWLGALCYQMKSVNENILINKYLFYFLQSRSQLLLALKKEGGVPAVNKSDLAKLEIPVPPLSIQAEIVRILDTFTELTAELTAELVARRQQYAYYREQLLTFEEGAVEWKDLGEVGTVRMCKRVLKSQTSDSGGIPFYKIGTFGKKPNAYITRELFDEYKTKYSYPQIGEVLISASGTIGRTVIFDGRDAYFQDSNIVWIENNESKVLNKYLFYLYQVVNWNVAEGGTIKRLYNDNLRKLKIPIPPLAEQQRIVAILDKFDTLTTSLTEGLPREIALRQQQYEYYRELLLSFSKAEVAIHD